MGVNSTQTVPFKAINIFLVAIYCVFWSNRARGGRKMLSLHLACMGHFKIIPTVWQFKRSPD